MPYWGHSGGMGGQRMVDLRQCLYIPYEMQAVLLIIWAKILLLKGPENLFISRLTILENELSFLPHFTCPANSQGTLLVALFLIRLKSHLQKAASRGSRSVLSPQCPLLDDCRDLVPH